MLGTGLSSAEIASLDYSQLVPQDPGDLRVDEDARLTGVAGRTVVLGAAVRTDIARYLEHERVFDVLGSSSALFLATDSDSTDRAGGPLSAAEVDASVGGERSLRIVTVVPGAAIPQEIRAELRQLVITWSLANGWRQSRSVRAVACTYEVAVRALHGSEVIGSPARAIFVMVLERDGSWAALVVPQSPPLRVSSVVQRPAAPEQFNLASLGPVSSIEF